MKTAIILVLLALLVFVCDRLVRVESQRQALRTGLCPSKVAVLNLPDGSCLFAPRPPISWFGYLSAAISSPGPAVPASSSSEFEAGLPAGPAIPKASGSRTGCEGLDSDTSTESEDGRWRPGTRFRWRSGRSFWQGYSSEWRPTSSCETERRKRHAGGRPPGNGVYGVTSSYDIIRYPNTPMVETHPSRLGMLAALCGRDAAPPGSCRVLELGCGEGNNIATMAMSLPNSEFVGLDLASVPIAVGNAIIKSAGLSNVTLLVRDITDDNLDIGSFDYVIAHGVYAWVPEYVRAALLRLVARVLDPSGVAFISYNVNPGCRLRQALRDILLDAIRHEAEPGERVEAGLSALRQHIATWSDDVPYQRALKEEAEWFLHRETGVLFHDELGGTYDPQTLMEVVEAARKVGLDYLSDAHGSNLAEAVFPSGEFEASLPLTGGDWARFEQMQDFRDMRRFRRSLFVRAGAPIDRRFRADRLRGLHASAELRATDPEPGQEGAHAFVLPTGARFSTRDAGLGSIARKVGAAWPSTVPLSDLGEGLLKATMHLYLKEIVKLASSPTEVPPIGPRPRANPLALAQAARGDTGISSILQSSVTLSDQTAIDFLRLLDGTRTRKDLAGLMASRVAGDVAASAARCEGALREFARMGLLVA